jgi:hypothetical protein
VLSYLNDVKDASEGRSQCAIKASNLHNLLTNLRFRLEDGHGHQPWFIVVQAIAVENDSVYNHGVHCVHTPALGYAGCRPLLLYQC